MRMTSHEMEAQQNQENRSTVPSGPDIMLSIILPSEFPLPQNTRIVLVQADLNASVGFLPHGGGGGGGVPTGDFFVMVFVFLIVSERNIHKTLLAD